MSVQIHHLAQYTGGVPSASLYVLSFSHRCLMLMLLIDVVVPIPLPISAILILVIGEFVLIIHIAFFLMLPETDLGFELFVALSFAWDRPETADGLMHMQPRKPVNERSISTLKRRALRRTKTLRRDSETQQVIPPGRVENFMTALKKPFTREFWEDRLESSDDERLVDSGLLSYAYLEAGIIETMAW
jgi:sodium/potassium-transporting ATPase subunit alpha